MTMIIGEYIYRFDFIEFGIAVRDWRLKNNLTLAQAGEILQYAGSSVSSFETAKAEASITMDGFMRVCNALDISPNTFFTIERKC